MAKNSRYASARIATTVNARYAPDEHVVDAYYLDGKFPGKRETRAADSTNDREDRGFLYALFAFPSEEGGRAAEAPFAETVHQLAEAVNNGSASIDSQINDLADCAVDVCGKTTLTREGVRQPYFSGIIVKEAEMAAVTSGSGCAYLYRGDVLYPLTKSDYPLEAIDFNGNPIEHLHDYAAGVAATIRYSNIAQVQQNDCLILCNKEVMEALGQREVLRILYEADDQEDAAGTIITAAAAKMPGVALQFMISFVEYIVPAEKTGRLNLGLFQTGQLPPVSAASGHEEGWQSEAATYSADREAMRNAEEDAAYPDEGRNDYHAPPVYGQAAGDWAQKNDFYGAEGMADDFGNSDQAEDPFEAGRRYAENSPDYSGTGQPWQDGYDQGYGRQDYEPQSYGQTDDYGQAGYEQGGYDPEYAGDYTEADSGYDGQPFEGHDDTAYGDQGYDDYPAQGYDQGYDPQYDQGYDSQYDQNYGQSYDEGYADPYQDPYYDEYQGQYDDYPQDNSKLKRIIFYVVLLAIVAVCIFALVKLLAPGKTPPTTVQTTLATSAPTTAATTAATTATTSPTSGESATGGGEPTNNGSENASATAANNGGNQSQSYIIQAGDSLWSILSSYYGYYDENLKEHVKQANPQYWAAGSLDDNIHEGWELVLPPAP